MSMHRLLSPEAVAIVGASADPQKLSGMMLDFLRRSGFAGRVYPINPRYEAIHDWRCYPSVDALPETVDVVVIAVPVASAFEALEAAGRRRVPFVVLMTGGFGEGASGEEGERRLARLTALCRETGLRVVGPNTVGMVNFRARLPLTFADWYGRDTGQRGGVAILTHSGSVGGLVFSSLQLNRVGVDYWIATGNEANLEVADFVEDLSDDAALHTIVCFMEGVMDGRRFMAAAAKARACGKQVVVLKAGDSPGSLRATVAHTRKRPTDADVYRAVFRQLGVVQVASLQELTYAVKLLAAVGRRARGRLGILSASGGACSLIADHAASAGLDLRELPEAVEKDLATAIPEYGSTKNPVDLSADVVSRRQILVGTLEALEADDTVDTWLVFGRPIIDRYHPEILAFARRTGKAVVASSGVPLLPDIEEALQQDGVAVLHDPELCTRALGAVQRARAASGEAARDWRGFGRRAPGAAPVEAAVVDELLKRYGLRRVPVAPEPDRLPGPGRLAALRVAIAQDRDFGPVLVMGEAGGSAKWLSGRVVRALPLHAEELREAVEELTTAGARDLDVSAPELLGTLDTLCRLYVDEAGVAEIDLRLVVRDSRLDVREAVLAPAGPGTPR